MTNRRAYQRYRTNLFLVLMAVISVVVIWGLAHWQNTRVSARSAPPVEPAAAVSAATAQSQPPAASEAPRLSPAPPSLEPIISDLRRRDLAVPVEGVPREALDDTFGDPRNQTRQHEALDIIAPRGTHVLAVEDGSVVKLFTSERGGLTLYQFDPTQRYAYYYAHLDAYAPGIKEQMPLRRGQLIGFVGTTGNAPKDTPHLHFAIFLLTDEKQWWQGTPINPFAVWREKNEDTEKN